MRSLRAQAAISPQGDRISVKAPQRLTSTRVDLMINAEIWARYPRFVFFLFSADRRLDPTFRRARALDALEAESSLKKQFLIFKEANWFSDSKMDGFWRLCTASQRELENHVFQIVPGHPR